MRTPDVADVIAIRESMLSSCSMRVTIGHTDKKKDVVVESDSDIVTFFDRVKKYNPYGFCVDRYTLNGRIFIAIDDLSLRLLDYVRSVDDVNIMSNHPVFSAMDRVFHETKGSKCESLDDAHSLFMVRSSYLEGSCGTLLKLLAAKEQKWYDDDYYIYQCKVSNDCIATFRVRFNNIVEARRFIAKASLVYSKSKKA